MKKLGAEFILAAIALPLLIWVVTSIFALQASNGERDNDVKDIKDDVKFIKEYLITNKTKE